MQLIHLLKIPVLKWLQVTIKNKAFQLGRNTVYLLTQRAGQTGHYNSDFGGGTEQTNVTLTGNVYQCDSKSHNAWNTNLPSHLSASTS